MGRFWGAGRWPLTTFDLKFLSTATRLLHRCGPDAYEQASIVLTASIMTDELKKSSEMEVFDVT